MPHRLLTDAGNLALLAAYDRWHHVDTTEREHVDFTSFRAGFIDGLRAIPKAETEAGFDRVKELLNA